MDLYQADVLICGAGIAGLAAGYYLSGYPGIDRIIICDERQPFSLTSDKSTECYRNFWPGPDGALVELMNHSISLMEEIEQKSGGRLNMNRRGYLYSTCDDHHAEELVNLAEQASLYGSGPTRVHSGGSVKPRYTPSPEEGIDPHIDGADFLRSQDLIQNKFPFLSKNVKAILHIRKAGWFSAQQLGMYLLEGLRQRGAKLFKARLIDVVLQAGHFSGAILESNGRLINMNAPIFVNAAGPFLKNIGELFEINLPVFCELHAKSIFMDGLRVIPRDAPLLIWEDDQFIPWDLEEQDFFSSSEETRWLLDLFPAGVHCRPEGGTGNQAVIAVYPYHSLPVIPTFPIKIDGAFPEIALLGLSTMIPRLKEYRNRLPHFTLDGGYYTKTEENRLLVGPMGVPDTYVIGAFSGYGLMAACAAGQLLAQYVAGDKLPGYAQAFRLDRYQNPTYLDLLKHWGPINQL